MNNGAPIIMDLIERENQEIYLETYNYGNTTIKYKSANIAEFLSKLETFLNQKNYGFCIPTHVASTAEAHFNIEPYTSIKETINGVKEYINNLTSSSRKDKFEYLLYGCFFYNKRNQLTWRIVYKNPIIKNRLDILNHISSVRNDYIYYSYHNTELSQEQIEEIKKDKDISGRLLRYKISNHKSCFFDSEKDFKYYKSLFRSKSIAANIQYEHVKNFYNSYQIILDLLSLPTEYEN
jgi:hypothetical protein